ncbi:MAG: SIR2 family protein [Bacteroidales bacterium]|nr:SIR2 family protein [Bacteroidales bacterium]
MENNNKLVLEQIKKSYLNKRIIPFIGSGFSKNIGGFPDWKEFIKHLSKKIGEDKKYIKSIVGDNYLQSVEYFMMKKIITDKFKSETDYLTRGKNFIKDELVNIFNKKFDKNTWQAQIALILLNNIDMIYTTNWDDTLEQTCENILGKDRYNLYYSVAQLEDLKKEYEENFLKSQHEKKKSIVKLHGHFKDSNSIIASEYDYFHRMNTFNALDIIFQNDLLLNDFLFIGFSFDDVNVNYLLYQINVMRRMIKPSKSIYLISIKKPDDAFFKLYEDSKKVLTYFLFDENEYNNYQSSVKSEKNSLLKRKTVQFFNYISDNELENKEELKTLIKN